MWPRFLPGARAVLFTILSLRGEADGQNAQVAVLDLRSPNSKPKILVRGGSDARYVPTGHLIYLAGTSVRAIAFDLDRLETDGTAVPVLDSVDVSSGTVGDFDVARDGTLVYSGDGAPSDVLRTMVWRDRQGKEEAITSPARTYLYPRISWNGDRVAVDIRQDENDIWTVDLSSGVETKISKDPTLDRVPIWTRDDRQVLFGGSRDGTLGLFAQASDGTGEARRLTKAELTQYPLSVSEDGATLLVHDGGSPALSNLMKLALTPPLAPGKRSPVETPEPPPAASPGLVELVKTAGGETNGEISPDGRWLVYQANETGTFEIYVRPYPDLNGQPRMTVSRGGGMMPHFSRAGNELFFLTLDGTMMSVPLRSGTTWKELAGPPVPLFEAKQYYYGDTGGRPFRMYDVSADGRRFLLLKPVDNPSRTEITPRLLIVQNWFEELKRLVPRR